MVITAYIKGTAGFNFFFSGFNLALWAFSFGNIHLYLAIISFVSGGILQWLL